MGDVDDYSDWQNPEGGYGNSQQPGSLYADKGTAPPKPTGSSTPPSPQVGPATSLIHVSVNAVSKIQLALFVKLINETPGIVPEFKGKIALDKKTNTIAVPDFSQNKAVPGKEWLFDLGKAGDDWEITTATLLLTLNGLTGFKFQEDLAKGEERGPVISQDPDDSLIPPVLDLIDYKRGLILGLTIPNQTQLKRNPPPANTVPPPQIARLKSGKGLILIAREIVVGKGAGEKARVTMGKDVVPIPKRMIAMTFFHELSAHASFFQLGQNAAHSEPREPANNAVDRNAAQAEESYQKLIAKELQEIGKKLNHLIDEMNKAVP